VAASSHFSPNELSVATGRNTAAQESVFLSQAAWLKGIFDPLNWKWRIEKRLADSKMVVPHLERASVIDLQVFDEDDVFVLPPERQSLQCNEFWSFLEENHGTVAELFEDRRPGYNIRIHFSLRKSP